MRSTIVVVLGVALWGVSAGNPCGCVDEGAGICINGLGCGSSSECRDGEWLCGGCSSPNAGPPIQALNPFPTENTYERGLRIELVSYGGFTWNSDKACALSASLSKGLSLTPTWTLSLSAVDWKGTTQLLTDQLFPAAYYHGAYRCQAMGGRLAGIAEYGNSGVQEIGRVCEGCWVGFENTKCLAYINGTTVERPCSEARPLRCHRLQTGSRGELTLQLYLTAVNSEPSSGYPLFVTDTKDEFIGRVLEVLLVGFRGENLALVPHGALPEVTVFRDAREGWYARRVKFDMKNTMEEYRAGEAEFTGDVKGLLGGEAWEVYQEYEEVGESTLRLSLGLMAKASVRRSSLGKLMSMTQKEADGLLTVEAVNGFVDILRVVAVHKIRFSDPALSAPLAGSISEPSRLLPTALLIGIACVASLVAAIYVWRTLYTKSTQGQSHEIDMRNIRTAANSTPLPMTTPSSTMQTRDTEVLTTMAQMGINPLLTGMNQRAFQRTGV